MPVVIRHSELALNIFDALPSKQIGSLVLPGLLEAVTKFALTLEAFIMVAPKRKKAKPDIWPISYIRSPIRIIVYGLFSEMNAVAHLLSEGKLYLQHPSAGEYDLSVPYQNPHYLLRPGASMPSLEKLSISASSDITRSTTCDLTVFEKARYLQVFESVVDTDKAYGIVPSTRLKSVLKE